MSKLPQSRFITISSFPVGATYMNNPTDKSFAKNANTSQQQNLKQILEKQIKINKNFLTIKQRNC